MYFNLCIYNMSTFPYNKKSKGIKLLNKQNMTTYALQKKDYIDRVRPVHAFTKK
jgi:hypothetical protein